MMFRFCDRSGAAMIATAACVTAAALAVLATRAIGGPLNPPAGAVAPSYKTLNEVEPRIPISAATTPGDADSSFRIAQPGSYYLTGNITGVVGKHGIEIAASGVTVDLNGFDVVGAGGGGFFNGIAVGLGGLANISVLNGSFRGWSGSGINLAANAPDACRISDVSSTNNLAHGFAVSSGVVFLNCAASRNSSVGYLAFIGCTFAGCTARFNAGDGFQTSDGATLNACTSSGNGGSGFAVGAASTVSRCTAADNGGDGFDMASACVVTACAARSNDGAGINAGTTTTVVDCSVMQSGTDGIQCLNHCLIRGNTCYSDGRVSTGAGIHATGFLNRIEGNSCATGDVGIHVDIADNFIVRNTCTHNSTNWIISAGNHYGPIVDRTGLTPPAVNGDGAASALGTTDANANFSY
jgi:hypothetical protein